MNIVFRVDSSLEIGSGHVMRCLALARALREGGATCSFICREHPGNMIEDIRAEGFVAYGLLLNPRETRSAQIYESWLGGIYTADALGSISFLSASLQDLLVVDHYAIDERWESIVKPYFKKIMVIDDLANRIHNCDYLLDQNLSHSSLNYAALLPQECKTFFGPRFALLRPEFSMIRQKLGASKKRYKGLNKILITLGGTDANNITSEILKAIPLESSQHFYQIIVVMGSNAPHIEAVRDIASKLPISVDVTVGVRDMANLMIRADLVITGAGTTVWEACTLGVPMLIKVLAQNQRENATRLQDLGAAIVLSDSVDFKVDLVHAVKSLSSPQVLKKMGLNASEITHGSGCKLISDQLFSELEMFMGTVRKMTFQDLDMVLFWRNHDDIKK